MSAPLPMSIEDRLRQVIASGLDINPLEVTPNASLTDDLGADSLDLMHLAMDVEDAFHLEIPEDDWRQLGTFAQALAYVTKAVALTTPAEGTHVQ